MTWLLLPFFLLGVIPCIIIRVLTGRKPGPMRETVDFYVESVVTGMVIAIAVLVTVQVAKR